MAILALVTKSDEIRLVVPWAAEFARVRNTPLTVLCWTYSPLDQQKHESTDPDNLTAEVQVFVDEFGNSGSVSELVAAEQL